MDRLFDFGNGVGTMRSGAVFVAGVQVVGEEQDLEWQAIQAYVQHAHEALHLGEAREKLRE